MVGRRGLGDPGEGHEDHILEEWWRRQGGRDTLDLGTRRTVDEGQTSLDAPVPHRTSPCYLTARDVDGGQDVDVLPRPTPVRFLPGSFLHLPTRSPGLPDYKHLSLTFRCISSVLHKVWYPLDCSMHPGEP